ncbi:MAG: hypothetical protein JOZ10_01235 [Acidobacteria bacterium]|nr:hypothetical protein [Acidobacteriota bacterium]MBV9145089.1 hypothetical protein [Acidobacteriota bacterium]MBV9436020.1 hypothetical protein [Acidobacteriota bacterium]
MDIRAILLVGAPEESSSSSGINAEVFAGCSMAFLPLLGRPILQRIAERLRAAEICSISVLNAGESPAAWVEAARTTDVRWKDVPAAQIWRAAEDEFEHLVHAGAELVLLLRLGPYAEIEFDSLIQCHLDRRSHVTGVIAADGPVDVFVLSSSRRNDAAFLLRNKLAKMRVASTPFVTSGYVNRLSTPADLRRLTVDSLMQKTGIQPVGAEIRPGVWVDKGARLARNVRLVAPCYIGASSKVKAGALITRGSSVEHHCVVDCASVVEASTLLPLSYVGIGLDVSHSVVGANRIFSTKFAAEAQIEDPNLVAELPSTSVVRTLSHAASLFAFVPRQILQSFRHPRLRPTQVDPGCTPSNEFDASALAHPIARDRSLSSGVVAGVRDYGNQ